MTTPSSLSRKETTAPQRPFVGVATPSLIYVGCPDREEFDKIAVEARDIRNDNGHVLTKMVEGPGSTPGRPVKVVFQHWLELKESGNG